MLTGAMAVTSFAGTINVDLSMTEAINTTPGEEITVDVFVDANSGIGSACLIMKYDTRYFSLVDVVNGELFAEGDLELNTADDGEFMFWAMKMNGFDNITKTGKLFSAKFKVLKTAYNGEHTISISHREDNSAGGGEGWFIDFTDDPMNPTSDVNIPIKNATKITVSNSTVNPEDTEALKETTAPETDKQAETKAPSDKTPVTDKGGETVKTPESNKAPETKKPVETVLGEPVKPAETEAGKTYESEYVTDDKGETVLNEKNDPELVYREVIEKEEAPDNLNTVILVVSVCAVFAAGIIVAIVFVNNKKNKK